MTNFELREIAAASKDAAQEYAKDELYFSVMSDATAAYRKWKDAQGATTSKADLDKFCLDQLTKKTKNLPGVGLMVVLDKAIKNSRKRPYEVENVKNESGERKMKKTYTIVDMESRTPYFSCQGTKTEALKTAKDMYKNGTIQTDVEAVISKEVVEGEAVAFRIHYTPSEGTQDGNYLLFGYSAE